MDIISNVYNRKMALTETERNISYTSQNIVDMIKNPSIQHEQAVKEYFKEVSHYPYADNHYKGCLSILNTLRESGETWLFQNMTNYFLNETVSHMKDVNKIRECASILTEFETKLNETATLYETVDRIINNNSKIEKRFDLSRVVRECKLSDTETVSESLCNLIDTYDAPVYKKLNIALEEAIYLYEKNEIKFNKADLVQNVLEYFLRENDILTDIDYRKIKNILETNVLLSKEDISKVKYIFQHESSFAHRLEVISEAVSNEQVKSLLKEMSQCKTLNVAKAIIKKTCNIIVSLFVVGAVITYAEVMTLLIGLFTMILIVATSPGALITAIKDSLKTPEQLDAEQKAREKRVRDALNNLSKEINKVDAKQAHKEAAIAFDTIYKDYDGEYFDPSMTKIDPDDDHMFSFDKINFAIVTESEDYADSDDVKKVIDKYKAEQNKSEGKLKRAIEHIYTKSPEQIIDGAPHILSLIRNFGILATATIPHVGIPVSLVLFCTDKFIEMSLKRKEAEKVLAHFQKEKEKVEKDIDKAKSESKIERLESYSKCLDKCITKLEDYRDGLYSEKELDRMKGYDEAVVIDFINKISLQEYFEGFHDTVCYSIQLAVREIKKILINESSTDIIVEEYDIAGTPIDVYFRNNVSEENIGSYLTPEGILSVPLFKIKFAGSHVDTPGFVADACIKASRNLGDKYLLSDYTIGSYKYIIFNFTQGLAIDYMSEIRDYATTEEVRESMAYLEMMTEAMEIMEACEPDTIVKDMAKAVDRLVTEDLNAISTILANSGLQPNDFIDSLEDYKDSSDDYNTNYAITNAIKQLKDDCDCDYTPFDCMDNTMIQMESFVALREILEASKDKTKKGNVIKDLKARAEKGIKPIKKKTKEVKNKVDKDIIITKTKAEEVGEKVSKGVEDTKVRAGKLTTNLNLAFQGFRRDLVKLTSKEKEMCKGLDASLSSFKRGIEKSLTSDRREGIIRGSIIPSFSRCIKLAIAGGITYAINPVMAVIAAIGALGVSVSLTHKERKAILDEIDIELKVVEKEIELAEKDDDMKKYKQLLKYQKALRRESQRIRYKLKIKGQSLPDPEA